MTRDNSRTVMCEEIRNGDIIVSLLDDANEVDVKWEEMFFPALVTMAPTATNGYALDVINKFGKKTKLTATSLDKFVILPGNA